MNNPYDWYRGTSSKTSAPSHSLLWLAQPFQPSLSGEASSFWARWESVTVKMYLYLYIYIYIQIYPDLCVLDKQHKTSVHQVWLSLTQVFKCNRQSLTDFSCCCHRPETQRLLWLLSLRHQQYHRKLCCSPATRLFCPICLNTGNILISCHATFVTQTLSSFPLLTFDSSFVFPSFLFVFLQADVIYKMSMADRWVWHFL